MGKGDKKTKKGKITSGSYGVSRKRKKKSTFVDTKPKAKKVTPKEKAAPEKTETTAKKTTAKKTVTKKATAKKTTTKKTATKKN